MVFLRRNSARPSSSDDARPPDRPTLRAVDDAHLLEGARAGDEQAFVKLVERYQGPLVRLARAYVPTDAVAEEAVQETWMGVVRGIDRFEGRSSFKTWLFRILVEPGHVRRSTGTPRPPTGPTWALRSARTLRRSWRVGTSDRTLGTERRSPGGGQLVQVPRRRTRTTTSPSARGGPPT